MHPSIDDIGEEDQEIKEESNPVHPVQGNKILKCKRSGCKGELELINGAYRCRDCWKTYFYHEID